MKVDLAQLVKWANGAPNIMPCLYTVFTLKLSPDNITGITGFTGKTLGSVSHTATTIGYFF